MAKVSEWQGGGGAWYAADTSDLGNNSGTWYHIPRLLGIPLDKYIEMLVKDYGVDYINLTDSSFICFSWTSYNKCHRFVLDMNRRLRQMGLYN
jgi:hypothetical protein